MTFFLHPLDKMETGGLDISLGMTRHAVENAMGPGRVIGKRHYYYNSEVAIDYDVDNNVEFIEFLGDIDIYLRPVIYGVSAFHTNADELVQLLKEKDGGEVINRENGHCLLFPNISVGLYRDITPAEVLEMAEEMKAAGIPTENNADLENDRRRAEHWSAIGMGVAGYYR